MNCSKTADPGWPIGSVAVEGGNRMLATQRLKRSGQRRGRDGCQDMLAFRALFKSGCFDQA